MKCYYITVDFHSQQKMNPMTFSIDWIKLIHNLGQRSSYLAWLFQEAVTILNVFFTKDDLLMRIDYVVSWGSLLKLQLESIRSLRISIAAKRRWNLAPFLPENKSPTDVLNFESEYTTRISDIHIKQRNEGAEVFSFSFPLIPFLSITISISHLLSTED